MKQMHKEKTCACCQVTLKWWNVQSCAHCGKCICSQHAHTLRKPHSSVLFSLCVDCINQHDKARNAFSLTQPETHKKQLVAH